MGQPANAKPPSILRVRPGRGARCVRARAADDAPMTRARLSFDVIVKRHSKLDAHCPPIGYDGKVVSLYRYNC
jgi:hypothetical protein